MCNCFISGYYHFHIIIKGEVLKTKVLFVNQPKAQCGVYEYGRLTGTILENGYGNVFYIYREIGSPEQLYSELEKLKYDFVVYNHHPCTMTWLNDGVVARTGIKSATIKHDNAFVFNGSVIIDSDPNGTNGVPRPLYINGINPVFNNDNNIVVGAFGFGFGHKGFSEIITRVNNEFDSAVIRLRLPVNSIVDSSGSHAFSLAAQLRKIPLKNGIKLEISHDYLSHEELIKWLSGHTVNCFLYRNTAGIGTGCSSATDWALASGRPIAVSNDVMFRHLLAVSPQISVDNSTLRDVIGFGTRPLEQFYDNWSWENLYKKYSEIVRSALENK